jgi:2-acylglycerol O-acyltransferase 2
LSHSSYGLVPFRKPLTVVVGSPISVEKIENPTTEDIANYHNKYVAALQGGT